MGDKWWGETEDTSPQQELSRSWVSGPRWGVPRDQNRRLGYRPGGGAALCSQEPFQESLRIGCEYLVTALRDLREGRCSTDGETEAHGSCVTSLE